ncbi:hypothetical protein VKT23_018446 [Stygiomarasmius scandens]|uniref:Uncharacterized protein n=1 Tax=Marasmiellus scandens TaxID=2682957 RepID=A0ABR1ITP1_9AGAR
MTSTSADPGIIPSSGSEQTDTPNPPKSSANNDSSNTSAIENRENSTVVIVGGIFGGLAFIALIGLLVYWREKRRRPRGDSSPAFFQRLQGTRAGISGENGRPIPYDLKHVFADDQPIIYPPEPIPTPTTAELSPNERHTFSPARTRTRALSESSLTRAPSITARSILTARQLNIRSEADNLRMQLSAIQQARQLMLSQENNSDLQNIKDTLAVIMAHIQRLDRQFESDWARGLTDEAPPEYFEARR